MKKEMVLLTWTEVGEVSGLDGFATHAVPVPEGEYGAGAFVVDKEWYEACQAQDPVSDGDGCDDPDLKTYEVTLYFHTNCTVTVRARDEREAVEEARCVNADDQLLSGLQEDGSPEAVEV